MNLPIHSTSLTPTMIRIANLILIFAFVIDVLAFSPAVAKREASNEEPGLPTYTVVVLCIAAVLSSMSTFFTHFHFVDLLRQR